MKNAFFLVIALLVFGCVRVHEPKILFLKIEYIPLDLESPLNVNCEAFDTYLKNEQKEVIIKNADSLEKFQSAFDRVSFSNVSDDIDVRIKIFVAYKGGQSTICIGQSNDIVVGGRPINSSQAIIDFVSSAIKLPK